MPSSVHFLWWASIVAESALLLVLLRRGLARVYPFFTAYLWTDLVVSLGMMWLVPDPRSKAYARAWSVTEPMLVLMQIAFAVELYVLISRHYRNFDRIRPRLFWSCLIAALFVSLIVVFIDKPPHWTMVRSIVLGKRVAAFALVAFILVVSAFLRIFPIPIRRNVTIHRRISAAYFLVSAANYFTVFFAPRGSVYYADMVIMVLTGGCFISWAIWLKPEGESVETPPGPTQGEIQAHLKRGEELARTAKTAVTKR